MTSAQVCYSNLPNICKCDLRIFGGVTMNLLEQAKSLLTDSEVKGV